MTDEQQTRQATERGGIAEGEDVGRAEGAPAPDREPRGGELRESDVRESDALDDRVEEEELPGDES